MMRMRIAMALYLVAGLTGGPALAEDAVPADPAGLAKGVIEQQITAFLNDDAAAAYSFASPEIKSVFPNPERFFEMVKKSYGPVYRPGNYAFGRNQVSPDGKVAFQEVLISSPDGKDWAVYYELKRQSDGKFAINGVRIKRETTSQGI
ncbi:DUF4864 domain-containing protein [Rhizobium wuzhouense]|uniref:DUF4864 domain-containing protein n=2 Tax=Rhizobium/Agrobacterium group TaxID=227290 RepID=A0ABX5NV86_9HYPH|nr:DUF4864 domain-containing protein [Rhizobium wuzhouense]RKE84729.1 uncharacterized protein DUF4864 [Rhizobium sp. AG855]